MKSNILWAIVFFIVIYLYWPKKAKRITTVNVGIALLITKQPNYQEWFKHHIDTLGVRRVYARIEDAPDIVEYVTRVYPSIVYHEDIDSANSKDDNYFTLMDRQSEFISKMIGKASDDGIDYLFHIDSDELINVRNKTLKEHLLSVPDDAVCIHFKNYEAVFNSDSKGCFNSTVQFIDCQRDMCKSYANGKSAAVIYNNPKYHGPHYFTGRGSTYEMPDNNIRILHFDSCTFDSWNDKFTRLATKSTKTKDIPLTFYRDSINVINSVETDKRAFYQKHKTLDIDCYVINMAHRRDRMQHFMQSFRHSTLASLNLQRVDAINGNTLKLTLNQGLTPGMIGCALSHFKVYEIIQATSKPYAYIFEDDAEINADYRLNVDMLPYDWDIVLLGYNCSSSTPYNAAYSIPNDWYGLWGYIINRFGVDKMLKHKRIENKEHLSVQIDAWIQTKPDIKVYINAKNVVGAGAMGTDVQSSS